MKNYPWRVLLLLLVLSLCPSRSFAAPQRIAVLFPQAVLPLLQLGLEERLVAIPDAKLGVHTAAGNWYLQIAPRLAELPDIGFPGRPNMETLISLTPDLVVSLAENQDLTRKIEQAGLHVLPLRAGFARPEEWLDELERMGRVLGCQETVAVLLTECRAALAQVDAALKGILDKDRPRVACIGRFAGEWYAGNDRTRFIDGLLERCGAIPYRQAPGAGRLNREELLAFSPRILLCLSPVTELAKEAWWKELPAVRDGRVHDVPTPAEKGLLLSRLSPSFLAPGLKWLLALLHPGRGNAADAEEEYRRWLLRWFPRLAGNPEKDER